MKKRSCETQQLMSEDMRGQDVWDKVRDELHYWEELLLLPAAVTWKHQGLTAGTNYRRHVSSVVVV